ncbi:MAG TPA: hypothetical protein VFO77_07930, partial [Actinoplanes sp.]|nr:hypothetical protein [Actinoplanes sp.]
AQWLGTTGGTGDQRAATKITVKAGKVTSAPKVKLDKAGTVTGTVTTADGKTVPHGDASLSAWDYGAGGNGARLDRLGRYKLDGLGPYRWPLVFTTQQGRQWSGGKGNRYAATTVQVNAGETVTHNEVIGQQAALAGKVRVRTGAIVDGFLTAYTVSTGDQIGDSWFFADGRFSLLIPGGERVKIEYYVRTGKRDELTGWHDRASTFEKAKVVEVPATGAATLDLTAG